jgi:hypothetical protein
VFSKKKSLDHGSLAGYFRINAHTLDGENPNWFSFGSFAAMVVFRRIGDKLKRQVRRRCLHLRASIALRQAALMITH